MTVGRMGLGVAPHGDFVPAAEQKQMQETAKHVSTWAKKLEAQRAKTYNPRLLTTSFEIDGLRVTSKGVGSFDTGEKYTARVVKDGENGKPRLEAVQDDYFPDASALAVYESKEKMEAATAGYTPKNFEDYYPDAAAVAKLGIDVETNAPTVREHIEKALADINRTHQGGWRKCAADGPGCTICALETAAKMMEPEYGIPPLKYPIVNAPSGRYSSSKPEAQSMPRNDQVDSVRYATAALRAARPAITAGGERIESTRIWTERFDTQVLEFTFSDRVEEWALDMRDRRQLDTIHGYIKDEGVEGGEMTPDYLNIRIAENWGQLRRTLFRKSPKESQVEVSTEMFARSLFDSLPDAQAFIDEVSDFRPPNPVKGSSIHRYRGDLKRVKVAQKVWDRDDKGFRTACMQLAEKMHENLKRAVQGIQLDRLDK